MPASAPAAHLHRRLQPRPRTGDRRRDLCAQPVLRAARLGAEVGVLYGTKVSTISASPLIREIGFFDPRGGRPSRAAGGDDFIRRAAEHPLRRDRDPGAHHRQASSRHLPLAPAAFRPRLERPEPVRRAARALQALSPRMNVLLPPAAAGDALDLPAGDPGAGREEHLHAARPGAAAPALHHARQQAHVLPARPCSWAQGRPHRHGQRGIEARHRQPPRRARGARDQHLPGGRDPARYATSRSATSGPRSKAPSAFGRSATSCSSARSSPRRMSAG
jgi:hypothetical protein